MISLKTPTFAPITTPLASLSISEASEVGQSLSLCLKQSKTATQGLVLWKKRFPCMAELCQSDPHFSALVLAVGYKKLMVAPWGMRFRVSLGAFLSILDMATDMNTIARFLREGRYGFAYASLGMIAAAIFFQMVMVYLQGRKRGARRVLTESLIVLSTLKPAVDAYRVVTEQEQHEDDTLDPFMEMILAKVAEM